SSAGKTAGVVNWVCTWPPFKVSGGFISEAQQSRPGGVDFSEGFVGYKAAAESIVTRWEYTYPGTPDAMVAMAGRELEQLSAIDREIMSKINPDLVAYYYYYTDLLQHFFWKDMDPKSFSGGDWAGEQADPRYRDAIRRAYIGADRFLSQLMDTYGPTAHYIVVSDHGARPVVARQVNLNMDTLLEEMGYLSKSSGETDRAASVCYPFEGGSPEFAFNLTIGPAHYTGAGVIDLERYKTLSAEVAASLMAVRLEGSREPIFRDILTRSEPAPEGKPDLVALVSREIMEMPDQTGIVLGGGRRVPTADLLGYHAWSGRHRARGILLAMGPAIRHRYSGAWTIDDAYTLVRRYTHGIFKAVDKFSPLFRRLHLMNEALTVDIAPTLLYLAGLPVAADMDGRVLTEIITEEFTKRNPVRSVETYPVGATLNLKGDAAEEQRIKQRLKAIGYLQ
ncbi:MAG: alkaline phosphatase family protein, partial [bacterium]